MLTNSDHRPHKCTGGPRAASVTKMFLSNMVRNHLTMMLTKHIKWFAWAFAKNMKMLFKNTIRLTRSRTSKRRIKSRVVGINLLTRMPALLRIIKQREIPKTKILKPLQMLTRSSPHRYFRQEPRKNLDNKLSREYCLHLNHKMSKSLMYWVPACTMYRVLTNRYFKLSYNSSKNNPLISWR